MIGDQRTERAEPDHRLADRLEVVAERLAEEHRRTVELLDEAIARLDAEDPVVRDGAGDDGDVKPPPGPIRPIQVPAATDQSSSPDRQPGPETFEAPAVPPPSSSGRSAWQSNLIAGIVALIVLMVAVVVVNVA